MRERESHQKTIENKVKIHPKIDVKSRQISYSKKWCKKHRKSSKIEPKSEPETIQKPIKNRFEKKIGKRCFVTLHPGSKTHHPGTLKPNSSSKKTSWRHTKQDILQKKDYLRRETPHTSNTPRRPQARSGYIGPKGPPGPLFYRPAGGTGPRCGTAGPASVFRIVFRIPIFYDFFNFDRIMAPISTLFHIPFC